MSEKDDLDESEWIKIRGTSHFYGDLWVLRDGDEYFWFMDNYNGGNEVKISKELYEALLEHNKACQVSVH